MRITTEKVEELRVALEKVGFRLLGISERLITDVIYTDSVNLDGSLKDDPPSPKRDENTYVRLDVFPLAS
jgi:hypothetical protein